MQPANQSAWNQSKAKVGNSGEAVGGFLILIAHPGLSLSCHWYLKWFQDQKGWGTGLRTESPYESGFDIST